jgi:hypothetical protein
MRDLILTVLLLAGVATAAQPTYQTGVLVDITHQDSSRVFGSTQNGNGSVGTAVYREYQIAVKVGDTTYVGSYWPRFIWSYAPTDFVVNTAVKVRLTKKEMYVVRDGNKELKTKIIKRVREAENSQVKK